MNYQKGKLRKQSHLQNASQKTPLVFTFHFHSIDTVFMHYSIILNNSDFKSFNLKLCYGFVLLCTRVCVYFLSVYHYIFHYKKFR